MYAECAEEEADNESWKLKKNMEGCGERSKLDILSGDMLIVTRVKCRGISFLECWFIPIS